MTMYDEVNHLPDTDKIKILVVENDLSTQLLYEKGLFDQVFDKKMTVSGKAALHIYNEWQPDVIMIDIYLPELNGYFVLKEIRTLFIDKKTTIVMASSKSRSQDITSCMALGIEGHIVKPFSLRDIALKVLGFYAKKEPVRSEKAKTICQDILKQSPFRLPLNKDTSKTTEDTKGISDVTADTNTTITTKGK